MPRKKATPPLLDAAQAAFLAGPVSIGMASHDADRIPSLSRAFGCRVSPDRREVRVFLSRIHSADLLRDLAAGAPVAAVFSRPLTHETLQLKGQGVDLVALEPGDRAIMLAGAKDFAAELTALGYGETFCRALVAPSGDEAVAAVFTPTALFEQTPGPKAGARLEPRPGASMVRNT